jgi:hypothetical protein
MAVTAGRPTGDTIRPFAFQAAEADLEDLRARIAATRFPANLVAVEGLEVEATACWPYLQTPETYRGCRRSGQFASPDDPSFDERRGYVRPARLCVNQCAVSGGAEAYTFTIG